MPNRFNHTIVVKGDFNLFRALVSALVHLGFKGGQIVCRQLGLSPKAQLVKLIDRILGLGLHMDIIKILFPADSDGGFSGFYLPPFNGKTVGAQGRMKAINGSRLFRGGYGWRSILNIDLFYLFL